MRCSACGAEGANAIPGRLPLCPQCDAKLRPKGRRDDDDQPPPPRKPQESNLQWLDKELRRYLPQLGQLGAITAIGCCTLMLIMCCMCAFFLPPGCIGGGEVRQNQTPSEHAGFRMPGNLPAAESP